MRSIRRHLTYANVMATIAVFIAISGGTAVALSGTNTVFSDDIVDNQVFSADVRNESLAGGGLAAVDLRPGSVGGSEVVNESLTGADIKNRSGVDTCQTPLTAKFGPICAGSDGQTRTWFQARDYCAGQNLRLPSFSEAATLGLNNDVPGVPDTDLFWTDEVVFTNSAFRAWTVGEDGATVFAADWSTSSAKAVCVTDPSA
jgi:hypothetical protein